MESINKESKRVCYNCKSETTYKIKKSNGLQWYNKEGNIYCYKCHNKLFTNPKFHPRRMWFGDKRILLKSNPRIGICYNCGKEPKRTEIHHIEYHPEYPLKDTFELCAHCHALTKCGRN